MYVLLHTSSNLYVNNCIYTHNHNNLINWYTCTFSCTDVTPSSVASFNDSRCAAGGVCSTDPLLFTCEVYDVTCIQLDLPNGHQTHYISFGDTAADIILPDGFMAVSLAIVEIDNYTRNFTLTLSIANASLLDGGEIGCTDTLGNGVMTACPLCGKLKEFWETGVPDL